MNEKRFSFELLKEFNLIGCFDGEKSFSQNYKKELSKSLSQKFESSLKEFNAETESREDAEEIISY